MRYAIVSKPHQFSKPDDARRCHESKTALEVVPQEVIRNVPVPQVQTVEKLVEVPQLQIFERVMEVPQVQIQEVVRNVPRVVQQEVIVEQVVPSVQTVQKMVEVIPQIQIMRLGVFRDRLTW